MRKEGNFAIYQGKEYEANYGIREEIIVLFSRDPRSLGEGFREVRKGVYVKRVPRSEIQSAYDVTTYAEYGGHPFRLYSIMNKKVHLGYSGPEPWIPSRLGFTCIEPYVFEKEVSEEEVTRIWQEIVPIWGFSLQQENGN